MLAAAELHFKTQTHAPLHIGGIPDMNTGEVRYGLEIPSGLSLLAFHDPAAEVKGLNDFPREDWPPVAKTHYAFEVMVGAGSAMALLAVVAGFLAWRKKGLPDSRLFLWAFVASGPLGFIALEAGWLVTELGRQPWIMHGIMRTRDAVTPFPHLLPPFWTFTALYLFLGVAVVYLLFRQLRAALIEKAIGPIWEANHVWLILAIVMLFAAFPGAFAVISIALHIPLTIFLIGVVFRGSAFTFRAYDDRKDGRQQRWGLLFSLASVASPILLGDLAGTIASGQIKSVSGVVTSGYFAPWLQPFPIVVGLFALALFAYLAAVVLSAEAEAAGAVELTSDFRRRALHAGVVVGALALVTFALSFSGAPRISAGLTQRPWTWPLHVATATASTTAFVALWKRRFALARFSVVAQTIFILLGWAASQYPYLLVPTHTLTSAAANPRTQKLLLIAIAAGSALLFPSLYALYRVFKGNRPFRILDRRRG